MQKNQERILKQKVEVKVWSRELNRGLNRGLKQRVELELEARTLKKSFESGA